MKVITPEEIYDELLQRGVKDPACLKFGQRFIVGRWEEISTVLPNGHICRSGKIAICVLGDGDNWIDAREKAIARLAGV